MADVGWTYLHFNPRPREEGDSFHCLYYTVLLYFNPRPREEGDGTLEECREWCRISIHALVKRATAEGGANNVNVFYFNPRPREEGDS